VVFSFCSCLFCLLTFLRILVFFSDVERFPMFSFSVSFIFFEFKNSLPSDKLFKAIEQQQWSRSLVSDSATPWTVAYQAPHSWDFPGRILEWVAISFSRYFLPIFLVIFTMYTLIPLKLRSLDLGWLSFSCKWLNSGIICWVIPFLSLDVWLCILSSLRM